MAGGTPAPRTTNGRRDACPTDHVLIRHGEPPLNLSAVVRDERFVFDDLREVFARANEEKSGDRLAGIAARSQRERVAAKRVLAGLTLAEVVDNPLVDPDRDEVSRLTLDALDRRAFARFAAMTVGEFREWILDDATT